MLQFREEKTKRINKLYCYQVLQATLSSPDLLLVRVYRRLLSLDLLVYKGLRPTFELTNLTRNYGRRCRPSSIYLAEIQGPKKKGFPIATGRAKYPKEQKDSGRFSSEARETSQERKTRPPKNLQEQATWRRRRKKKAQKKRTLRRSQEMQNIIPC